MSRLSMNLSEKASLPADGYAGALAGRVWRPRLEGPSVAAVRRQGLFDVTRHFPTLRDLCEEDNPAAALRAAPPRDRPVRRDRAGSGNGASRRKGLAVGPRRLRGPPNAAARPCRRGPRHSRRPAGTPFRSNSWKAATWILSNQASQNGAALED